MDPDMPKGKLLRDSEGGDGENPGEEGGQPTLPGPAGAKREMLSPPPEGSGVPAPRAASPTSLKPRDMPSAA